MVIDQEEIKTKAIEFDIHHPNVERDYVFGWLLKSIFENDYLKSRLIFKGGNCLRKAFYPNTRFSADLDFSVGDEIVDADPILTPRGWADRAQKLEIAESNIVTPMPIGVDRRRLFTAMGS